jgi:hypothetical protein
MLRPCPYLKVNTILLFGVSAKSKIEYETLRLCGKGKASQSALVSGLAPGCATTVSGISAFVAEADSLFLVK